MRDFRRGQGRKHTLASAMTVYIVAWMSGFYGPVAAVRFAASLTQLELRAIGAWRNPESARHEPISKSTMHRIIQQLDPA